MIVSIWRNLWRLSAGEKSTSSFTFSLRYCKELQNFCFRYSGHTWQYTPKLILSTSCRKLSCLSAEQKSTSTLTLFWRYCNDVKTSYFGHFGWLHRFKMIEVTCRRLFVFFRMPKIYFAIHFFLEILHFKESCNSIGWQHFGAKLEN